MQKSNNYETVLPDKLIILDHVSIKGFIYLLDGPHKNIIYHGDYLKIKVGSSFFWKFPLSMKPFSNALVVKLDEFPVMS